MNSIMAGGNAAGGLAKAVMNLQQKVMSELIAGGTHLAKAGPPSTQAAAPTSTPSNVYNGQNAKAMLAQGSALYG
ncbi:MULTISPECIES: hypothetical protein [Acidithrix]|uniref:Killing trait n=1 Tax=Acidithrix ferrooxidans TaxID=1280514 RepID=A0A0D8HDQ6_9ACTN|nr:MULTISPECIES: hypothetical protein [Acidithrix]KJF16063.1 hypothetical protein AXFE_30840 [Acidithrix ferrooxidans]CAG4904657.1 unnamed protein product [Acidithrix sp. C25]